MRIREWASDDLDQLKAIHRMNGYGFELPNIEHPLVLVKKVLADENNVARMVALGRLHINAMLFVDPHWNTPEYRFNAIVALQEEMLRDAGEKGLDIATTQADGRFAERLTMQPFNWTRGWGTMMYRDIQ
jgi:hypothetical protein